MITSEKEFWQHIYNDMKAKEEQERSFEDEEKQDNERTNSGGEEVQKDD